RVEKVTPNALRSGNGNALRSGNSSLRERSALARTTLSPLAFCSEEERRIIERYNQFCDQRNKQLRCRRWLPVTKHTDKLCDAVACWSCDPNQFDELLQRIGSGKVKLRRKCQTLVALCWRSPSIPMP